MNSTKMKQFFRKSVQLSAKVLSAVYISCLLKVYIIWFRIRERRTFLPPMEGITFFHLAKDCALLLKSLKEQVASNRALRTRLSGSLMFP